MALSGRERPTPSAPYPPLQRTGKKGRVPVLSRVEKGAKHAPRFSNGEVYPFFVLVRRG